jgi:hypothetical protein
MKASKGSRKIVLNNVEYRWRASGNDGYIVVTIWPLEHPGPTIRGTLKYDESFTKGDTYFGCWVSEKNQIVVTNRLIRRVIEYASEKHDYSHLKNGPELNLRDLEKIIDCSDAIKANKDNADRRDILLGRIKE